MNQDEVSSSLLQFGIDFLQKQIARTTTADSVADEQNSNMTMSQRNLTNDNINNNSTLIRNTREYSDFMNALKRLQIAQRQFAQNLNCTDEVSRSSENITSVSFLQYTVTDDLLMHIFSYLNCHTFVTGTLRTCIRWNFVTKQFVTNYVEVLSTRYTRCSNRHVLSSMELLHAYEIILGIQQERLYHEQHIPISATTTNNNNTMVPKKKALRIPMMLPSYTIRVSDCGDTDYNGIYHCTNCNGNGYVFTKPRNFSVGHDDRRNNVLVHDPPLRCIISKKFSNEDIFWYMGKEVLVSDDTNHNSNSNHPHNADGHNINNNNNHHTVHDPTAAKPIQMVYHFWAPLMQLNDLDYIFLRNHQQDANNNDNDDDESSTTAVLMHYPSFTSALQRQQQTAANTNTLTVTTTGTAWQSLSLYHMDAPPIVELVD